MGSRYEDERAAWRWSVIAVITGAVLAAGCASESAEPRDDASATDDVASDAGGDGSGDVASDRDTGRDVSADAAADGAEDAAEDAAADARVDASVDATADTASDATPDAATDAAPDAVGGDTGDATSPPGLATTLPRSATPPPASDGCVGAACGALACTEVRWEARLPEPIAAPVDPVDVDRGGLRGLWTVRRDDAADLVAARVGSNTYLLSRGDAAWSVLATVPGSAVRAMEGDGQDELISLDGDAWQSLRFEDGAFVVTPLETDATVDGAPLFFRDPADGQVRALTTQLGPSLTHAICGTGDAARCTDLVPPEGVAWSGVVVLTDIDVDGWIDIAAVGSGESGAQLVIQRRGPTGTDEVEPLPPELVPHQLVAADLDGDGTLDLGAFDVVLTVGHVRFGGAPAQWVTVRRDPRPIDLGVQPVSAAFDIDDDGAAELFAGYALDGGPTGASAWRVRRDGAIELERDVIAGGARWAARDAAVGDVDGDGQHELVVGLDSGLRSIEAGALDGVRFDHGLSAEAQVMLAVQAAWRVEVAGQPGTVALWTDAYGQSRVSGLDADDRGGLGEATFEHVLAPAGSFARCAAIEEGPFGIYCFGRGAGVVRPSEGTTGYRELWSAADFDLGAASRPAEIAGPFVGELDGVEGFVFAGPVEALADAFGVTAPAGAAELVAVVPLLGDGTLDVPWVGVPDGVLGGVLGAVDTTNDGRLELVGADATTVAIHALTWAGDGVLQVDRRQALYVEPPLLSWFDPIVVTRPGFGHLELVRVEEAGVRVDRWYAPPEPGLDAAMNVPSRPAGYEGIALSVLRADLDGDAVPEVIVRTVEDGGGQVYVLHNDLPIPRLRDAGSLPRSSSVVGLSDVDGDGTADLVLGGVVDGVRVLRGTCYD